MDAKLWQRVDALFQELVDLEPAAQKAGLVAEPDPEVRREVAEMLDVLLDPSGGVKPASGSLSRIVQAGFVSADGDGFEAAPEQVGPYRLVREIGRGGMATVYLAERDGEFSRKVAVKLIRRGLDTEEILERLRLERQILAHLDHPYIARMFEGGTTDDGRPFFVMEAIEGQRIDTWCATRQVGLGQRLELFRKVCEAVDYAHQNLVLHRDIKPSNILVTEDGTPKLLDFGIAKVLGASEGAAGEALSALPTLTRPGDRLLTPEFAAPEQMRGDALSTAADVYSLGVVLYGLLTGKRPFELRRADLAEMQHIVETTHPESPSTVVRRAQRRGEPVPVRWPSGSRAEDLDNVTLMALRKEPERRYGSARELADDLRRLQEDLPVRARKDTLKYRTGKFVRRNRRLVATTGVVFLTLLGAVGVTTHQARIAREETRNTRQMYAFLKDVLVNSDPYQALGKEVGMAEILDDAARKLEDGFHSSPEVEADLATLIGTIYRNLLRYDEAEAMCRRALEIRRRLAEPRSLTSALVELGQTLVFAKRGAEAEPFLQEALELQDGAAEPDPVSTATILTWMAEAAWVQGDLDGAEHRFQKALEIHPQVGFDDSLATLLNSVGKFREKRGALAEARQLFGRSLELRRKTREDLHPEVLDNLTNLAGLTAQIDGREASLELYLELLESTIAVFGPDHPRVGSVCLSLGIQLSNIAGRADEGAEHLDRALRIAIASYGEVAADVAEVYQAKSLNRQAAGDLDAAAELAERALAISLEVFGEDPAQTFPYYRMAAVLAGMRQDPAAERKLEEAVALGRRLYNGDNLELAYILLQLGKERLDAGAAAGAEPVLREALGILSRLVEPTHWLSCQAQGELGRCLMSLGQEEEGRTLLRRAYAGLLQDKGPDHKRTLEVEGYMRELGVAPTAGSPES